MSCNSIEQASYPSSGALSLSGSEAPFSFSQIVEGYDNEFVPHPESRYECPICLLVLREPRQTRCGHRFCRDCIIRSLRDSSNRCPVDNEPLTESDIYPDNFAKREILNFSIKCPNNKDGCDKIFPLGKLQNHLEECPYALTPCPYKCTFIMQRIDVDAHIGTSCENRMVICEHCHSEIQAKFMQNHLTVCPEAIITCPHCKEPKARKELNLHVQTECQLVEVHCPFYYMGCNHTMMRSSVDDHLMLAGSSHMSQLCYAVTCLAQKLGMTHLINGTSSNSSPKTPNNGLQEYSYVSSKESQSTVQGGSNLVNISRVEASGTSDTLYLMHKLLDQGDGREMKNVPVNNGKTPVSVNSFDDGHHRITVSRYQSHDPVFNRQQSVVTSDSETEQNQRQFPRAKLPVRRLNYQPVYSIPSADVVSPHSGISCHSFQDHMADVDVQTNLNAIKIIQEFNSRFEERHALQQQKFNDLYNKFTAVEQLNATLVEKVRDLEQQLAEKDALFLNGDFYWSINNFSHYRAKLASGESSLLHSAPFYTSPWGYKMCVRANVDSSSTAGPHLSLFVHFMKGKNDAFLTWPFSGKITIYVVDQNPNSSKRMHMKETLTANPNLAAFQRPTTTRNHKGFGYMEFLSIAALENSSFWIEDTLVIRVQVFDDSR